MDWSNRDPPGGRVHGDGEGQDSEDACGASACVDASACAVRSPVRPPDGHVGGARRERDDAHVLTPRGRAHDHGVPRGGSRRRSTSGSPPPSVER